MDFSAAAADFFKDFAEDITVDGEVVRGLLDLTPGDVYGVVGVKPQARFPHAVLINRGSVVVSRGVTYDVSSRPVDESGIWLVELNKP